MFLKLLLKSGETESRPVQKLGYLFLLFVLKLFCTAQSCSQDISSSTQPLLSKEPPLGHKDFYTDLVNYRSI